MAQYSRPVCVATGELGAAACPEYRVVTADWEDEPTFADRLVHALGHRLPNTRILAVLALKGRAGSDTAMPLAQCARAYVV